VRLAIELLVYAAATAGLAAADQTMLAIVFAVVAVANSAVVRLLSGKGEARGQTPGHAL
jgi:acid phosphatase family membrane protein YuiD